MSNDRTRSPASKGQRGTPNTQSKSKSRPASTAKTSKPAQPAKKTAASQRFAERQARKQQAAQEARRARNRRYGLISIALVLVVVVALVIVKVAGSGTSSAVVDVPSPPAGTPIPAATLAKLASVPMSTLAAAPTDGILTAPQSVNTPALTANGKPDLLAILAQFCPHCGAQRWPLYIALSKFGTFHPEPGQIHSANTDGDVPTFSFYGTKYTSPYFTFTPVEAYTNHPASSGGYTTLQTPTPAQLKLWEDVNGGSFPFIDFGGKEVLASAQYSFEPMQNLSFSTVAKQVGNNSTTIGANIDASAYQLIQTMCHSLTSGQPAAVCSSAAKTG